MGKRLCHLAVFFFIVTYLTSCTSSSRVKDEQQLSSMRNLVPVFGFIENTGDKYSFSSISLTPKYGQPWVNLLTGEPQWDLSYTAKCIKGIKMGGVGHQEWKRCEQIDLREPLFYSLTLDKLSAGMRTVLAPVTLGTSILGTPHDLAFDQDAYENALEEAMSGISFDSHDLESLGDLMYQYLIRVNKNNLTEIKQRAVAADLSLPPRLVLEDIRKLQYSSVKELVAGVSDAVNSLDGLDKFVAELTLKESEKEQAYLTEYTTEYAKLGMNQELFNTFINRFSSHDPLGYVERAKDTLSELREKAEQEVRRNEMLALKSEITTYRENLKSGDDSHCGLVIEVKETVVMIQTMVGQSWIKVNEIYPPNVAGCSFLNGVYQPPSGLPL